ncbi:MAG: uroporphyrinogen-III synthase [Thiohalocapsa sp.]
MSETSPHPLAGRRIAILEHRELDRLGGMLEAQGAATLRVPLVAIADAPDAAWVVAWLRRFVAQPPDDLVLMTGEGLRRLCGFAERAGEGAAFRAALGMVRTVTRGPKPAQALRQLGLAPGLRAERPTTDGVITALRQGELIGRRVGVQLYPDAPPTLAEFLTAAGARPDPVLPYAYVPAAADAAIEQLIGAVGEGQVDAVAFTSTPQVTRLFEAAAAHGLTAALEKALRRTRIAAVGPVVAAALTRRGLPVAIMPADAFFMKPLVSAIVAALAPATEEPMS